MANKAVYFRAISELPCS